MIRLAVFASGGGTTARYILEQTFPGGSLHGLVEVPCLVTSRKSIKAVDKFLASDFAGTIYTCDKREFSPVDYEQTILEILHQEEIDWFGQYGWLPKMPEGVVNAFRGINQHPAPVPHFGGKGMYSRAPHQAVINFARITHWEVTTVATAQLVAAEYDLGGILAEVPLEVNPNWDAEELQARLLPLEWQCQVMALLRIAAHDGEVPPTIKSHFQLQPGDEVVLTRSKTEAIAAYPRG